jgi:LAGLIDADG endonuclease
MQEYFECGTIRPDRSDKTLKWETRSLPVLVARIIPHFETYPLLSGKCQDFELFTSVCMRMTQGEHLTRSGLREIVRLAAQMNPSGKRGYDPVRIIESLAEMKA